MSVLMDKVGSIGIPAGDANDREVYDTAATMLANWITPTAEEESASA